MSSFSDYPAFSLLKELGKKPIDLTASGILTSERIHAMRAKKGSFQLLYATERVTEEVLEALLQLACEAKVFDKMKAMQEGEKINAIEGFPSENRAVLHTATRDIFDSPMETKAAKEIQDLYLEEIRKLKAWLHTIEKEKKFSHILQIGIGGSDLGPRALSMALTPFHKKGRKAFFLSNVDPDDGAALLEEIDLSKTIIVSISKSGTTLETLTNEAILREALKKKGLNAKDHFIAVTGYKSPMDDPSRYSESFYLWDCIGGRYSSTSMVGGVVLSFLLGIEGFLELLRGAHEMDQIALKEKEKENLPLLSALLSLWNRNFLHLSTEAIIPYSQALLRFPAHLQQCAMESNGKRIDKKGREVSFDTSAVVWGEVGTNGQHSFYQLLHQGTEIVPVEFIGFSHSQYSQDLLVKGSFSQEKLLANLFAQSLAFALGKKNDNPNRYFPGNRPNRILLGKKLDPFTMGSLLAFYEHKVAFQGFLWGINSFDQEGVQLGKILADKILELFIAKRIKGKRGEFPQGEAMLDLLEY